MGMRLCWRRAILTPTLIVSILQIRIETEGYLPKLLQTFLRILTPDLDKSVHLG